MDPMLVIFLIVILLFTPISVLLERRKEKKRHIQDVSSYRKIISFDKALSIAKDLGVKITPGIDVKEVIEKSWGENVDEITIPLLYQYLGGTIEEEPWTPISKNVMYTDLDIGHFDDDACKEILEEVSRISEGKVTFDHIETDINYKMELVKLSFDFHEQSYQTEVSFKGGWINTGIFSIVNRVVEDFGNYEKLAYIEIDTGVAVQWMVPDQLEEFRRLTGLDVKYFPSAE